MSWLEKLGLAASSMNLMSEADDLSEFASVSDSEDGSMMRAIDDATGRFFFFLTTDTSNATVSLATATLLSLAAALTAASLVAGIFMLFEFFRGDNAKRKSGYGHSSGYGGGWSGSGSSGSGSLYPHKRSGDDPTFESNSLEMSPRMARVMESIDQIDSVLNNMGVGADVSQGCKQLEVCQLLQKHTTGNYYHSSPVDVRSGEKMFQLLDAGRELLSRRALFKSTELDSDGYKNLTNLVNAGAHGSNENNCVEEYGYLCHKK